jgi:hypothetical protein
MTDLTKRDRIAAMMLQGMLSGCEPNSMKTLIVGDWTRAAVFFADALIRELERTTTEPQVNATPGITPIPRTEYIYP